MESGMFCDMGRVGTCTTDSVASRAVMKASEAGRAAGRRETDVSAMTGDGTHAIVFERS